MGANTLEKYVDTVVDKLMVKTFLDKIFKRRFQKRRDIVRAEIYGSFKNVAESYHRIACQNFHILAGLKCQDAKGKATKKLSFKDIEKIKPVFKP